MTRKLSKLFTVRTALGLALACAGATGAVAGRTDRLGAITIPENLTIFSQNDPNLRKASVVVNGEVITGTDVDQRLALIVAANDGKIAPEEVLRLRLQVLRNLMDETLQIQEAKAQEIEVDEAEVEQTYARVAQQNFSYDPKAMDAYLARIGSSPASLKRQIRGELSWQRLLRRNITPVRQCLGRRSEGTARPDESLTRAGGVPRRRDLRLRQLRKTRPPFIRTRPGSWTS